MNDILEAVDGGDLSLTSLAGSADNENLIILSDWDRADLVILLDFARAMLADIHTPYFSRSSLLRGALMMVRLTLDGASKCDLRDFLLEEWVAIWDVSGEALMKALCH